MIDQTETAAAAALQAVDEIEVLVLVDNQSDFLSTVPESVTPELPGLRRAGLTEISGEGLCCAPWGFSLVVTARLGDKSHTVLFDAGPEDYAVERNGDRLGVDFGAIEAIVLSHGHFDHAGGLLAALDGIRGANGGHAVPVHVNSGMFETRGVRLADGTVVPFKDIPNTDELVDHGAELVNSDHSRLLLDDTFFVSGDIPRITPYEKGLPSHISRSGDGADWQSDPWIRDERFLAVRVRDKGVVVFTACTHAGIVNVLGCARDLFAPEPLHAVMGGFHLSGADCEAIIPETVADIGGFGLKRIVTGHCTGWRAVHALINAFGEDVVVPTAVGRLHAF
jgi:7,8-dihydropterin-6-yl-methyl-4-(beta-D-ribofuranosyl)aminobenzene 5'-phosphate synthase